jgi:hypothetical protein
VAKPSQLWTRETLPNALVPVPIGSDLFGFALAAGRFRGSAGGSTDLAVSAPNAASTSGTGTVCCSASGLVHVLAGGTAAGLGASNHRVWHQNTPGILDESETGDRFGGA